MLHLALLASLAWSAHAAVSSEWDLLAHGSTRFMYGGAAADQAWTTSSADKYNLPEWAVPFNYGPTLAGGINQRTSDGAIHVQVLGTRRINLGSEWPGGGATKAFAPPYVWEIDGATGETTKVYDLSAYGEAFYSVLRYTPSGNPVVAVCSQNDVGDITLVTLDRNSTDVVWSFKPSLEPMLLATSNSNPPALLYAGMDSVGSLDFDATGDVPGKDEVVNAQFSAIIWGTAGDAIYNDGWFNENEAIYRLALPLQANAQPVDVVDACQANPWLVATDSAGNVYTSCDGVYRPSGYSATGKTLWQSDFGEPEWVTIDDDETVVIVGGADYWGGIDLRNGKTLFNTTLAELAPEGGVACTFSAQPWAPRHPIPTADGRLAVLCHSADGKTWDVRTLSTKDGSVVGSPVALTTAPVAMLTADSAGFVYAWGNSTGAVSGEKVQLPQA